MFTPNFRSESYSCRAFRNAPAGEALEILLGLEATALGTRGDHQREQLLEGDSREWRLSSLIERCSSVDRSLESSSDDLDYDESQNDSDSGVRDLDISKYCTNSLHLKDSLQ